MKASKIRCLISAGPTREFFDPVRYISNPSSGKMGYAMAQAALEQGWDVDVVSGPVTLKAPLGAKIHNVVTGQEMHEKLHSLFTHTNILIMTAAVCDFRPKERAATKVKKTNASMTVEFEPVIDILKTLAATKTHQCLVGFAAETNDVETYARKKLQEKNLDWIVANTVGLPGTGFEADTNKIILIGRNGTREEIGPDSKTNIARALITRLSQTI